MMTPPKKGTQHLPLVEVLSAIVGGSNQANKQANKHTLPMSTVCPSGKQLAPLKMASRRPCVYFPVKPCLRAN